ncbi:MAG TPA: glycosyltransferase, partial [Polyangiales bacterium]|nr:glycosyltransferase [Polyangiales bacterium]
THDDVQRDFGIASERVSNGVERARFERPSAARVSQLRRRLGLEEGEPVLVSFGGIEPRKNTLRLLDAFLALRTQLPVRWLIVGGASILDHSAYRDAFEQRLSTCSDADKRAIVCTGVLSEHDITAAYALASVVAAPSLREGFGLVALEALAASVPLVASRQPPFTEYLDDECAFLVDPEDTSAIVAALSAALQGSPERVQNGLACARRFAWDNVARQHESFYRSLSIASPVSVRRRSSHA